MENSANPLSRQQIDEIGRELDALRAEIVADLGDKDAAHIRRVVGFARGSAIAGRTLLMFGITPVSFGLGVVALSAAKILENMEIGHNVLHGQYDWMNDPTLDSQTYEWDIVCDASQWRHYHNYEHHAFTNVLGKDRDIGYGFLRVSDAQEWRPEHLFQPVLYPLLALMFQWGVATHDLDLPHVPSGEREAREFWRKLEQFGTKAARQLFKDYVLFPLLAQWNAPRVFAGNLSANGIRNVWTNVIIFCGHFPEGTRVFTEEEIGGETRGDWYPEIAPRVRDLCERYGLPYNTGSFWQQYGSVLGRIVRLALPPLWSRPAASPA